MDTWAAFRILITLGVIVSASTHASILDVCPSGCTFSSIQAAVNTAVDGDTVLVGDGTYRENITVNRSITIRSVNGPQKTSVEPQDGAPSAFTILYSRASVSGFRINKSASQGIWLYFVSFCNVSDNNITNTPIGVALQASSNNTIKNNTIIASNQGLYFIQSSHYNNVTGNRIPSGAWGLYSDYSSGGNIIYNNVFGNTMFFFSSASNRLNVNKTAGRNIINGSFIGGNYWADYQGNDSDGDGIGDTPRVLDTYNTDYLPLFKPSGTTTTTTTTSSQTTTSSTTTTIPSDSCYDTDSGVNTTVAGYVTGYSGGKTYNYSDLCTGGLTLTEWFCDSATARRSEMTCAGGSFCVNGRCVQPATSTTKTTCTTTTTSTTSSTTTVASTTTSTSSMPTSSSTTTTRQHLHGDADDNGQVNYADLIILATSYGKNHSQSGYDPRADFNSDRVVNYADLLIIAANYGKTV